MAWHQAPQPGQVMGKAMLALPRPCVSVLLTQEHVLCSLQSSPQQQDQNGTSQL
jgi:hypothetical protein